MRYKRIGLVCQNCIYGINKKGKWKKILFYYTGADKNGKKYKKRWNVFCEKKQKYYGCDRHKKCFKSL